MILLRKILGVICTVRNNDDIFLNFALQIPFIAIFSTYTHVDANTNRYSFLLLETFFFINVGTYTERITFSF